MTSVNSTNVNSLDWRCLALTGTFETSAKPPLCFGATAGNFDGQGLSFGALQWNLGQNTLQPLLRSLLQQHPELCESIWQDHFPALQSLTTGTLKSQLAAVASWSTGKNRSRLAQPWNLIFARLGAAPECQALQVQAAAAIFQRACSLAAVYGCRSERAVALMFDICTQNGSIPPAVKAKILSDFAAKPNLTEVERLIVIANRRAEAAKPAFAADVRNRKLCIANGEGMVHGIPVDLATGFGISLDQVMPSAA